MQAACEALPAELRRRIEGRRIKHDGTYNAGGYLRKGVTPTDDPHGRSRGLASGDPASSRQRPRRRSISGGGATPMSRVARERSPTACSTRCGRTSRNPRFVYEHVWRLGDLVMWDNRSTMHRRDPFDSMARRIMHRTQIKGSTRPVAFAA